MNVLMTAEVQKWARKAKVTKAMLYAAAVDISNGKYEADHGAGLYKKRVAANSGQGKSGGARTLVAWNQGNRIIFLFGFKKNQQDSVPRAALPPYKKAAKVFNSLSDDEIEMAVNSKVLFRIK